MRNRADNTLNGLTRDAVQRTGISISSDDCAGDIDKFNSVIKKKEKESWWGSCLGKKVRMYHKGNGYIIKRKVMC